MNVKQLVCLWCGIGLLIWIIIDTIFLPSNSPNWSEFILRASVLIVVTIGFIVIFKFTFKSKTPKDEQKQ